LRKKYPKTHWELRKGNAEQASLYCKKEDTWDSILRFELGAISKSKQGKRTDLHTACDLLKDGVSMSDVARDHPTVFVKFNRGLYSLQNILQPSRVSGDPREVIVLWGEAGSGKTLFLERFKPSVYLPAKNNTGKVSFETYFKQQTIFLDEFCGTENLGLSDVKMICDRHDCVLPGRGVSCDGMHSRVVMCSNLDPREWYSNGPTVWWNPFVRRMSAMYRCVSLTEWYCEIFDGNEIAEKDQQPFNPTVRFNLNPDDRKSETLLDLKP